MDLARDVVVRFGGLTVLTEASLHSSGGVTLVMGANGAGKTTLLEVIAGLRRPESGTTLATGMSASEAARRIGYVPQDPVFPAREVLTSGVQYGAWLRGLSWSLAERRGREALESVELTDRASSRIGELSGGMRRRMAIACALAHDPEVLLLDEALVGLDPMSRQEVARVIRDLVETVPVVLSTHVLSDVTLFEGASVAILNGGRVVQEPLPDAFTSDSEVSVAALERWYRGVIGA